MSWFLEYGSPSTMSGLKKNELGEKPNEYASYGRPPAHRQPLNLPRSCSRYRSTVGNQIARASVANRVKESGATPENRPTSRAIFPSEDLNVTSLRKKLTGSACQALAQVYTNTSSPTSGSGLKKSPPLTVEL
ncbi:MAG: hypothetical protein P8076_02650 [Gammaproteobacteria bacterium]